MNEGPANVKDRRQNNVIGDLGRGSLIKGRVDKDTEERRQYNDCAQDVPRRARANPRVAAVTHQADDGSSDAIRYLAREHSETRIGLTQVHHFLDVIEDIGKPSGGAEVIAEVPHCVCTNVYFVKGVSLDGLRRQIYGLG